MTVEIYKSKVAQKMKSFIKNEDGATAIEYGLIASLVATAIITGATSVGDGIDSQFDKINGHLGSPPANSAPSSIPINIPPANSTTG